MDTRDPAEAVEVLDLLLKFFGDGERRTRGIWRTRFPPQRLAITVAGTVPDSEPAFAELCPEDGIGSARLSFAGTVFLILTMGVRTLLSCGCSSSKRGQRR